LALPDAVQVCEIGRMPLGSFRAVALADLVADSTALRRLIDEGETLIVERKQMIPSEGLGPTVASFANTFGGWLLLGVADDKTIAGYDAGSGDFQDRMRHRLREEVDPMPPFAAQLIPFDEDRQVGVIRTYESADRPHLVLGTGAVWVREPGGKRAIRHHRELLQLAQYGREAENEARRRLATLPYSSRALNAPELASPHVPFAGQSTFQLIVRATPLTIPAAFADRALASQTGTFCVDLAREIYPGPGPPDLAYWMDSFDYDQRGFTVTMNQRGRAEESSLVLVDAGGVVAVRFEWPKREQATLHPTSLASDELTTVLDATARLLAELDAYGRCLCQLILRGYGDVHVTESRYGTGVIPEESLCMGGELSIPPGEGEVGRQADWWGKEIGRAAGLAAWQS
jgi:hypothetical protein